MLSACLPGKGKVEVISGDGGLVITDTFYFVQDQYDPQYRGRALFDLGEVILVAALWAAAALALARCLGRFSVTRAFER